MGATIGALTFDYDLIWQRPAPVIVGSDVQARDGSTMSIRVLSPSQSEKVVSLRYEWESWAAYEALQAMALLGGTYTMRPEGRISSTYTVRFAADNPVPQPKHSYFDDVSPGDFSGYTTDHWTGTINVIIVG